MSKSSFGNAPDDILYTIFLHVSRRDLIQCQQVCRNWLLSSRRLFLKKVEFLKKSNVEKFLDLMETHQDAKHCHAIKKVIAGEQWDSSMRDEERDQEQLDANCIQRLFKYFPRVEEIELRDDLMPLWNFPQSIRDSCPRLERVLIDEYYLQYEAPQECYGLLFTLRDTLVQVKIKHAKYFGQYGGPLQYLLNFPRLTSVCIDRSAQLSNFQAILPLFEHLPDLNTMICQLDTIDVNKFVDNYLESKPANVQSLVIDRLSRLQTLIVTYFYSSLETLSFISRYLTGLNDLTITYLIDTQWTEQQTLDFCGHVLDSVHRIPKYEIFFQRLQREKLQACLAVILQKSFQANTTNTLRIIRFTRNHRVASYIKVNSQKTTRTILCVCPTAAEDDSIIIDGLRKTHVPIHAIEFTTYTAKKSSSSGSPLHYALQNYTTLTKVILRYPKMLVDNDNNNKYTQVTHLELNDLDDETFKSVEDFVSMFPSLVCLTLNYYDFSTEGNDCSFRLSLNECKLERLCLDLTPFKYNQQYIFKESDGGLFFIIKVQLFNRNKQQLFKVSIKSLSVTPIASAAHGSEICISLFDLEYLELQLYNSTKTVNQDLTYLQLDPKDVLVARIPFT